VATTKIGTSANDHLDGSDFDTNDIYALGGDDIHSEHR
jgi:hypothetical protein